MKQLLSKNAIDQLNMALRTIQVGDTIRFESGAAVIYNSGCEVNRINY